MNDTSQVPVSIETDDDNSDRKRAAKKLSSEDLLTIYAKRLADEENAKNGLERGGSTIRIPTHMSLLDAAKVLQDIEKRSETEEAFMAHIPCEPNDGLVSFKRAMDKTFGKLLGDKIETMFGTIPPRHKAVPIAYGQTIQVPYGKVTIPGIKIDIYVEEMEDRSGIRIHGRCKSKFTPIFREIERLTNIELRTGSIYRGQAIDNAFNFLNLDQFKRELVVFPTEAERQLEANIWTPLRNSDLCEANGISMKRGILLHGPYGTGKTLTALTTAQIAVKNKWTFINVKPGQDFTKSLETARLYEPAVVFIEDIDASTKGERNKDINQILETFDGLVSKDSRIMVIVTTNHIEKINRGMLRPGRLDAVIEFGAYDKEAVVRFVTIHARDENGVSLLEGPLDDDAIYEAARGYMPAYLAEGVKRAKIYAIARHGADSSGQIMLSSQDIESALKEMRSQFNLVNGVQHIEQPTLEVALQQVVQPAARVAAAEAVVGLMPSNIVNQGNAKLLLAGKKPIQGE